MKHLALLIVIVFAIAGSTLFAGQNALATDRAPAETKQAANESDEAVHKHKETPSSPLPVASVAPQQPMADASNQDHPLSISDFFSALEVSFSGQESDAEWSHQAEQQVRELFLPLTNKDTSLISVQCRTTLCRAELRHATEAEFKRCFDILKIGGVASGWKGQTAGGRVETNRDGTVRSVFYLAKQGTTLPLPSPVEARAADDTNDPRSR